MAEPETTPCLNCSKNLSITDKFCSVCGQKAAPAKVPLKHLFSEFFADYFTFDSKLFRSIVPLMVKPGFLTSQYIEGKRARYIPPLRVFIFISILFFLAFTSLNNWDNNTLPGQSQEGISVEAKEGLSLELNHLKFSGLDSAKNRISEVGMEAFMKEELGELGPIEGYFARQAILLILAGQQKWNELFINYTSKLIFLLLPVFALLLSLLYYRKSLFFYEHFIFSLHFHTFLFIYFFIHLFFSHFVWSIPFYIPLILAFLYLFFAMRKVYKEAIGKTVLKLVLLSLSYTLLFIPFLILVVLTTVVFY
jgi:hypothetical protein